MTASGADGDKGSGAEETNKAELRIRQIPLEPLSRASEAGVSDSETEPETCYGEDRYLGAQVARARAIGFEGASLLHVGNRTRIVIGILNEMDCCVPGSD